MDLAEDQRGYGGVIKIIFKNEKLLQSGLECNL